MTSPIHVGLAQTNQLQNGLGARSLTVATPLGIMRTISFN